MVPRANNMQVSTHESETFKGMPLRAALAVRLPGSTKKFQERLLKANDFPIVSMFITIKVGRQFVVKRRPVGLRYTVTPQDYLRQ